MRKFKVLLVDDSRNILKALQRLFSAETDYTIFSAPGAQEALRLLEKEEIDVMLTDENMPGISGTELLEHVRSMYPDVIRIMLTGMTDIEVAKKAINNGEIYRFFTKPWDDFELLLAVRYALRHKTVEKENLTLKSRISEREKLLRQLEKEHPGITSKRLTADGSVLIDSEG